jgi:predicted DNA-binding transcriptional regulator AlpA
MSQNDQRSESVTKRHLLNTIKAAEYLDIHPTTLATWRVEGRGPRYVKVGPRKVRYRPEDIETWLEANTHSSTRS